MSCIFFGRDAQEVREAWRVLKPGGLMVIYAADKSSMTHWKFAGPDTPALFGEEDLRSLLVQAGFEAGDVSMSAASPGLDIKAVLATARKQASIMSVL